ncbi:hypothetical protein LEP1GSC071_1848, partial [Leptospira santarosai str. JET]
MFLQNHKIRPCYKSETHGRYNRIGVLFEFAAISIQKDNVGNNQTYKRRLSAAVAILGIAATALSYCSKSSFGYSTRTTIPKLTLFFTNPLKAIGRLQSEPIPESIHITPAWEVAADIKITLEIAELIENDDFSKRTKLE